MILAILLLIPFMCLPFVVFYYLIKAAVKNGILDAQKVQDKKQVYKNGYIVEENNDNCSK